MVYELEMALAQAQLGFSQTYASNCVEIKGCLEVAECNALADVPVCSHGMQELHVSLVIDQVHGRWSEVHSL